MEAVQDTEQGRKVKAERLSPVDSMSAVELDEFAGDDLPLIRSGHVQYWGVNGTVGQFKLSGPGNVWHLEAHITDPSGGHLADELTAILSAFWDAQKPEYVTTHTDAYWPTFELMRSVGFHQVGVLPLTAGPAVQWGWRKCH